jgi:hypothetical protein
VAPVAPVVPVAALVDPRVGAWWQTAAAAWRAYSSPDKASELETYREAVSELLPRLANGKLPGAMEHAIRRGRPCSAQWFRAAA